MKRVRVKPSKGQSMVGFFGGIIFCFIGLFFVVPTFGPFGVIWALFAFVITAVNGYNAFSDKGVATHEITIDDDEDGYGYGQTGNSYEYGKSAEERLKELQGLYDKGLISSEEYQEKRRQILEGL